MRVLALLVLAACAFRSGAGGAVGSGDGGVPPSGGDAAGPDAHGFDAPPSGNLMATAEALDPGDINLTTEGTADWTHWGYTDATAFDHTAANLLTNASYSGSQQEHVTEVAVTATWTNGTPDGSASQTGTGTGTQSPGVFTFTAPATTTSHVLRVYVGGNGAQGKVTAALSDHSAAEYSDDEFSGATAWHARYTFTYNAASPGQTLTVTWSDEQDSDGSGFAMLLSATLQ